MSRNHHMTRLMVLTGHFRSLINGSNKDQILGVHIFPKSEIWDPPTHQKSMSMELAALELYITALKKMVLSHLSESPQFGHRLHQKLSVPVWIDCRWSFNSNWGWTILGLFWNIPSIISLWWTDNELVRQLYLPRGGKASANDTRISATIIRLINPLVAPI